MIQVIAIRKINGKRVKAVHLTGLATAAEATAAIGQMIGQDSIIDGYWDGEPETAPVS